MTHTRVATPIILASIHYHYTGHTTCPRLWTLLYPPPPWTPPFWTLRPSQKMDVVLVEMLGHPCATHLHFVSHTFTAFGRGVSSSTTHTPHTSFLGWWAVGPLPICPTRCHSVCLSISSGMSPWFNPFCAARSRGGDGDKAGGKAWPFTPGGDGLPTITHHAFAGTLLLHHLLILHCPTAIYTHFLLYYIHALPAFSRACHYHAAIGFLFSFSLPTVAFFLPSDNLPLW